MGDLACAPFGVPCHLLAPSTVRPHWGGQVFYTTAGLLAPSTVPPLGGKNQTPSAWHFAHCTGGSTYTCSGWEAVKQNGGGCDHQWCEVGNSGTLRSTMMAPNDAKKRVARHYLFLRIKRTTANGVLLKPTKPNNVKTNQNKTRKSTIMVRKGWVYITT